MSENDKIESILFEYLQKRLTGRQLELALAIVKGLSNEDIAESMGYKLDSAKQCCYILHKRFKVHSKNEFTAKIYRKAFEAYFSQKRT